MPDQSFDLKVFHKINTIIKEHPDNTPFEWFAVGYLWAHLNETLTLDAIFLNVNSVMRLNKLASLSLDDTNEVLIKMVNNLLGPKNNPGSPRKSSVSSTVPSKKGMEVVHETHESEDLFGQKQTKKKPLLVEDSKDNQLSGNLSDNGNQTRKDKKNHDDTSTTKKSTTMNDTFSLDSDGGKKGFKNFDMNKVKQTARSKTLETVVKDSKSPKSPRSPSFPLEEKSKSVPNQLKKSDVFNDDISSEEEDVLKSKKQKSYSRDVKSNKKAEPVVPAKPKLTPTFIDDIEEPVANKTPTSSKNPTPSKIVDQIMSTINNKKSNKNEKDEKKKEREFSDDYSYESDEELKPKQDKPVENKPREIFEQAQRMEEEEAEDDEESDGKSTSSLIATLGQKKSGNTNSNNPSANTNINEKKKEIPKPTWPEEYAVPGIRSNDERDNVKSESMPNVEITAGQDFELSHYNYYQSQQKNPDICTFGPEEIMDEINVPVNLIESQAQPTLQLENVISIDDDISSEDLRSAYSTGRTKLTEHYPAPRTVNESVENLEREIEMMRKAMYGDRKKPKAMETIDLVEIDSSEGNSPRHSVSVKKVTTKENRGGMMEEKTTYVKKAVKDVSFDPWSAGKDLKRLPQKSVEKLAAEKELMQDDDEKELELERTKRKEKSRVGGEGSKGNKKKKI